PGAPSADLRVLLIEDDPAARENLHESVREYQETATVDCVSAEQATLDHIVRGKYDVIFSDIRAPATVLLAQLSRTRQARRHTPTLLILWQDERDLAAQALRGGAYDFLRKPLDGAQILDVLDRTVKMRQLDSRAEERKRLLERRTLGLEENLAQLHQQTTLLRLLQDIAVSANEA